MVSAAERKALEVMIDSAGLAAPAPEDRSLAAASRAYTKAIDCPCFLGLGG